MESTSTLGQDRPINARDAALQRPTTRRDSRMNPDSAAQTRRSAAGHDDRARPPKGDPSTATTSYRFDAVDGLRGIAIISVLLYHSGWSTRGLFGVDAFFVVSGFLITFLLIREATSTGRIRIGRFYARRAKRLLPSLVLTLAAVLLLLWSEGTLVELQSAASTAIASVFQVANWHQIATGSGYWEQTAQIVPLGQMWSLSVTEQFYILWPLVIVLIWFACRRRPGALAIWLTVALLAASLVAPLQYDGTNSDRLYLGTDSRAVAFVAGAAAAAVVFWILRRRGDHARGASSVLVRVGTTLLSVVSLVAVVAVSVATESYHEAWLYQGGLAAVAVGIAVFTATLCFPANALIRPFSYKPFRVVGVVSYSMFLLHLPVFWLVQKATNSVIHPLALFVVGGFLTWLASMVLHHLIAEPLRTRSWKPRAAAISVVVGFALVLGLAWYLPIQRVSTPVTDGQLPTPSADQVFAIDEAVPFPSGVDGGAGAVAVVGDSVAGSMYASLAEHRTADLFPVDVTYGGCGIFDAEQARSYTGFIMESRDLCWSWKDKLRAVNDDHHPDVYLLHNFWDAEDQLVDGSWIAPCTDAWEERYVAQLEMLVGIGDELEQKPVILLSNDRPRDWTESSTAERLGCKAHVEDRFIEAHDNVLRLDLEGAVCPNGTCATQTPDGAQLYTDGAHFGPEGLALMAPWLQNELAKGIAARPS